MIEMTPSRTAIDHVTRGLASSRDREPTSRGYELTSRVDRRVATVGRGVELLVGEAGNGLRDAGGEFDSVPDRVRPPVSPNAGGAPTATETGRSDSDRTAVRRGAAITSSPGRGARGCLPPDPIVRGALAPTGTRAMRGSGTGGRKTREAGAPTPTSNHLAPAKRQCLGSSSPAMMSRRSPTC